MDTGSGIVSNNYFSDVLHLLRLGSVGVAATEHNGVRSKLVIEGWARAAVWSMIGAVDGVPALLFRRTSDAPTLWS